jgi:formylglycine-generating enzyme required for sulfatase activity
LVSTLSGANPGDVIKVAVGRYFLDTELTIPAGVTVIGGFKGGFTDGDRIYPGAATSVDDMTVLDGNSLVLTKPVDKHRVATVRGVLDGVLVRNGHVRNGNGGGLLIDGGGTVQNCIIRGNVAMQVPVGGNDYDENAESYGGGVYIANGKLINSVVAYNMANQGYGVAGANGEVINNTIVANTYAPIPVQVKAGQYRHYRHWRDDTTLPWGKRDQYSVYGGVDNLTPDGGSGNTFTGGDSEFDPGIINVDAFYLAQTEVTTSQYAVFANAVDMAQITSNVYGLGTYVGDVLSDPSKTLADLEDPSGTTLAGATGPVTAAAVGVRFGFPSGYNDNTVGILFQGGGSPYGLRKVGADFIYWPSSGTGNNSRVSNEAMSYVSWYGSLAYSLWIGGTIPTEAQWEFAARRRAVDLEDLDPLNDTDIINKYCNVYLFAGSDVLDNAGWWNDNQGGDGIHEVAKKVANEIGLYDMTGNVWEWCADWINGTAAGTGDNRVFYPNYETKTAAPLAAAAGGTAGNPVWNAAGSYRVLRGGSWSSAVGGLSLAFRYSTPPASVNSTCGFRPVLVP